MPSSSDELEKQGSSSTIISHYASSSSSDIVAVSEVQRPRSKPEDVGYIAALPVVPEKEENAKDITTPMPVTPNNEDNIEDIAMPIIPAVLSRLANLCTRLLR